MRTLLMYVVLVPAIVLLALPAGVLIGFVVGRATARPPRTGAPQRRRVAMPTQRDLDAARKAIELFRKERAGMVTH